MLTLLFVYAIILTGWCIVVTLSLVHTMKKLDALTWDVHHTKTRITKAHDVYVRGQQLPPTLHDTEARMH